MTPAPPELGLLDALARRAGEVAAPPVDDVEARLRVARAVAEAARRRGQRARRSALLAVAVAAVALVALVTGALARWLAAEPSVRPLVMQLPTGDRVTALEGARFRVVELDAHARTVRLEQGRALFEVRPLAGADRFEVRAGRTRVRVRGTVFSVARGERGRVDVEVFEGRVEVLEGGRRWSLGPRARLEAGRLVAPSEVDDGPLAREGRAAATRRAEAAAAEARAEAERVARAERTPVTTAEPGPSPLRVETAGAVAGPGEEPGLAGPVHARDDGPATGRPPGEEAAAARRGARPQPGQGDDAGSALAEARRRLVGGEAALALAVAREHPTGGAWRMLEADALRALGRHGEAADAYDRAARALGGSARAQAGYLAATLRRDRLHDARGALSSLDASGATRPGSPLEERALALSAGLFRSLGRGSDAREVARRYLRRFPGGGRRAAMEALLAPPPEGSREEGAGEPAAPPIAP